MFRNAAGKQKKGAELMSDPRSTLPSTLVYEILSVFVGDLVLQIYAIIRLMNFNEC